MRFIQVLARAGRSTTRPVQRTITKGTLWPFLPTMSTDQNGQRVEEGGIIFFLLFGFEP